MKYFAAVTEGLNKSLRSKKKLYMIENGPDDYDLVNAPLPGYLVKFNNGEMEKTILTNEQMTKMKTTKTAAKVAAVKAPVTKVVASKKLTAPKVAAIADTEEDAPQKESKMDSQANSVVAVKKATIKPTQKSPKPAKEKKSPAVKALKGALPPAHLIAFISKGTRTVDAITKYMNDRGGNTETSIRVAIGRLVNHPHVVLKDDKYSLK